MNHRVLALENVSGRTRNRGGKGGREERGRGRRGGGKGKSRKKKEPFMILVSGVCLMSPVEHLMEKPIVNKPPPIDSSGMKKKGFFRHVKSQKNCFLWILSQEASGGVLSPDKGIYEERNLRCK